MMMMMMMMMITTTTAATTVIIQDKTAFYTVVHKRSIVLKKFLLFLVCVLLRCFSLTIFIIFRRIFVTERIAVEIVKKIINDPDDSNNSQSCIT